MPCYTVKTTSVDIGKMNLDILVAALKAAGYTVNAEGKALRFSANGSYLVHQYEAGSLSVSGNEIDDVLASVKRAYSAECIRQVMGREWRIKETKNQKSINFQVTARR